MHLLTANKVILLFLCIFLILFTSCSRDFIPKPRGYNRIELPPHVYVNSPDSLPYTFEASKLARITSDSSWITMNIIRKRANPDLPLYNEKYWIDLFYDTLGANIEITYKEVHNREDLLKEYFGDAYRLTNEHQVKASSIDESVLITSHGYAVSFTELKGEVPSQIQFVTTDSVQHFLRGALYFRTATMNDSLAPVISYLREDILHLLNTLQWK